MKLKNIFESRLDDRSLAELYDELEDLPIHHQMARLQELEAISPGVAKEINDYEERTRLARLIDRFKRDFARIDSPERASDASNRAKKIGQEFSRRNIPDKTKEWFNKSEEYKNWY